MFPIHHILPQHLASHPVINFLANRFDIDGIRNRMALPATQELSELLKSSPHTGGHLGSYYDGFSDYLDKISSDEFKAGVAGRQWQLDDAVSDLNKLLAAAKYAQANGHLFANTPTGMTREQANEANTKWFSNWRKYAEDNEEPIRQMQDTVDQLNASGNLDGALHWPILSPTSALKLADRIEIMKRFPKGSPITQHFTAVGPVPALPGLVPSFVNTRLPGFNPIPPGDLNQPEGFAPRDPLRTYGLRGLPALNPDWQRIGQPPPSTAAPSMPQILQFHSETGRQMFMSDGSPMMGPNPYEMPRDPADPSPLLGLGIFAGAMAAPALLPTLPAWVSTLGALGGAGMAAGSAAKAEPRNNSSGGVFAAGAPPYDPFGPSGVPNANSNGGQPFGTQSSAHPLTGNTLDQETARSGTFNDRFGNWPGTAAVATPPQLLSKLDAPATPTAGVAAPEEVRRLTRANASNAGSVFESGSAPVPYLPSPEFNDRFGNWRVKEKRPQQVSSPVGTFADEPDYVIPPPIWGLEASANRRNDAEEWFSRWIQPLLRQD
ncbi:hypothetical protein JJC00_13375 [Bradyrhizobium diazoefficiens]|uniref:hypothetical protein n=1 Tax=Bradyrhizobium diazoefficiens TaxID=1355477 RepID=UPI00190D680B|nr:hypothetical protein [Bradyrhizobium diazoefficiens]QQO36476.1 hypothetical protein JJC00_13375 [Bradyrhizobium diazoefficiens]